MSWNWIKWSWSLLSNMSLVESIETIETIKSYKKPCMVQLFLFEHVHCKIIVFFSCPWILSFCFLFNCFCFLIIRAGNSATTVHCPLMNTNYHNHVYQFISSPLFGLNRIKPNCIQDGDHDVIMHMFIGNNVVYIIFWNASLPAT